MIPIKPVGPASAPKKSAELSDIPQDVFAQYLTRAHCT